MEEKAKVRLRLDGTREQKIETAKRIKAELQEHFPEMVELHQQLTELGMCSGTMADIGIVITPNIVYNKYQDNPYHLREKFARPPYIDEEIRRELQAASQRAVVAADAFRHGRGSNRRR